MFQAYWPISRGGSGGGRRWPFWRRRTVKLAISGEFSQCFLFSPIICLLWRRPWSLLRSRRPLWPRMESKSEGGRFGSKWSRTRNTRRNWCESAMCGWRGREDTRNKIQPGALQMAEKLLEYARFKGNEKLSLVLSKSTDLLHEMVIRNQKQSSIYDYFKKLLVHKHWKSPCAARIIVAVLLLCFCI